MTNIKFKNGSEIQVSQSDNCIRHGCIKGRRVSNEEYQRIMFAEQVSAEKRLDKALENIDEVLKSFD